MIQTTICIDFSELWEISDRIPTIIYYVLLLRRYLNQKIAGRINRQHRNSLFLQLFV